MKKNPFNSFDEDEEELQQNNLFAPFTNFEEVPSGFDRNISLDFTRAEQVYENVSSTDVSGQPSFWIEKTRS